MVLIKFNLPLSTSLRKLFFYFYFFLNIMKKMIDQMIDNTVTVKDKTSAIFEFLKKKNQLLPEPPEN